MSQNHNQILFIQSPLSLTLLSLIPLLPMLQMKLLLPVLPLPLPLPLLLLLPLPLSTLRMKLPLPIMLILRVAQLLSILKIRLQILRIRLSIPKKFLHKQIWSQYKMRIHLSAQFLFHQTRQRKLPNILFSIQNQCQPLIRTINSIQTSLQIHYQVLQFPSTN